MTENPNDPRLGDAELAVLWRRQFCVLDSQVYGYLLADRERREAQWRRSWRGRWMRHVWPLWNRACWWCWHAAQWLAWAPVRPGSGGREERGAPWGWWLALLEWRRDRRSAGRVACGERGGSATVTLADLAGARYSLSVPRFYAQGGLTADEFSASDPLSIDYAGKLEAEFRRLRNEEDAVAE
jgi:hypothetical protein